MGVLTRGDTRRRLILLAAALGLIVAAVVIVPIGESEAVEVVEEDAGVLLLHVDSDRNEGWVRYYAPPLPLVGGQLDIDAETAEQTFTITRRCNITPEVGSLLEFSRTGGSRGVGAVSNGLGVKNKNNCSTAQGQVVSPAESLTFTLGGYFTDTIRITGGEVDVEGKGGTDLDVTYVRDGRTAGEVVDLSNSADNGPDSGVGDNEIAPLDPLTAVVSGTADEPLLGAHSVTFRATDGKIAIEGGGDGVVPGGSLRGSLGVNETIFQLAMVREYDARDLDCQDYDVGPTVEGPGPADAIELGRTLNLASSDPDKPTGCELVEYSFRIEDESVLFDANLDGQPTAHFVIRIEWDPVDVLPEGDLFDPPVRQIQFAPGQPYEDVHACTGLIDEGETVPGEEFEDPLLDNTYGHPTGLYGQFAGEVVPWCLAGEQHVLLPSGDWQQIQWYDGIGPDPRFQ